MNIQIITLRKYFLVSFFEDAFEDKNIIKNLRYSSKWMLIEFKSIRIIYSDIKFFDAKKTIYICLGILGNKQHFVLIL